MLLYTGLKRGLLQQKCSGDNLLNSKCLNSKRSNIKRSNIKRPDINAQTLSTKY